MSEIYYISLSIPHVQHAFKRGKYASEGVFPHMDHAFEQDKYTPVYTILLSTPVSTALAQHDFRTSKMYMNSFPSVLLQDTLYKEGIIPYTPAYKPHLFAQKFSYQIGDAAYLREHLYTML